MFEERGFFFHFGIRYLPGRTREQAFLIGNEMAEAITSQNPVPVKLKFEKVNHTNSYFYFQDLILA